MSPPKASARILLVDDDPGLLNVIGKCLETWGYETLKASTGEDALHVAQTQQPHLILLDILLPKMKGRDVCKRLKANLTTQHIPVIFLTALGLADFVKAGLEAGAEDYLIKPFQNEDLKERIKVCLIRHGHKALVA